MHSGEGNPLCSLTESLMEKLLPNIEPKVIFDIGANQGGYISRWLPHGECHAFEPVPDMLEKLQATYQNNPKVFIIPRGISDHEFVLENQSVYHAWMLMPATKEMDRALDYVGKPGFTVIFTTIDDYCNRTGQIPGFIKVDVDGYELRVLRGAMHTLSKYHPPMLFEYSFLPQRLGDSIEAMCKLIYDMGYKAHANDGSFVCPDWESMLYHLPEHSSFDITLLHKSWT